MRPNRLTTLVNEILDVSKLQSGVQSLEISTFDIVSTDETNLQSYRKDAET